MGGSSSKTLNSLTAQQVQSIYASAQYNAMQNCGSMPSDSNTIDVYGNFNNVSWINQVVNDGSQMSCTFSQTSQQSVQDELVAELVAKAESQATASTTYFGPFGYLSGGSLVNDVSVDVSSVQSAVTTIVTSQIQNCTQSSCNPTPGGAGTPGASGSPSGQCSGVCSSSDTSPSCSTSGNSNVVVVDGNFNTVTNNTQALNVDWIQNCVYNAAVSQNVTNSLQDAMNAASKAATWGNTPFTIFGWILWLAFIFVIVGGLYLGGRYLYRLSSTSTSAQ